MAKKIQTQDQKAFRKLSVVEGAKAFAELRKQVIKDGILKRAYGYYSFLMIFLLIGFSLSLYNLYIQVSMLWLVVGSVIFAFFAVQVGGLMHDGGHRAIFVSLKWNDFVGHFFCALTALGYSTWKTKHNLHHAHTNEEDEDPDVDIPFSFTEDRYKDSKGLVGFIRKYQAYLYFPLGSFVWVSIRFYELMDFKNAFQRKRLGEMVVFVAGCFTWFVVPFLLFDLSKALLILLIVNPVVGLYLLNVFAPNHKGMPQLGKGVKFSFLEQQIITSRNLHGHWLTDFLYMGLNYQIEHHLFPNTPRNKLKLISPYLKKLCQKYKLEYTSVNPWESTKIILAELNQVAQS